MSESGKVKDEPKTLPKTFVLELTRRCNHRCRYCYTVWGAPTLAYPGSRQAEMTAAEIKSIIGKLQTEVPLEYLALSGGEPLLREDLPEILAFLKDRGITPIIITNGTLLSKERVAATRLAGSYEVSLHSYRAEIHDHLSGCQGAWDQVITGMTNVRQAGGNLVAAFVATKLNYMDLFQTAELAIALGSGGMLYNRINLGAHNLQYADELLPTPAMIRENLDMLEELAVKYHPFAISISIVIEPCLVDLRKYKHLHFGWCPKGGKDSYFTIDPGGNVRMCNHSPVILGNLKRDSFTELFYHHPYIRSLRESIPVECVNCEPAMKELCRGGCSAAAEQCYGTSSRVDPFVTLSKQSHKAVRIDTWHLSPASGAAGPDL
jgi:radical SAM protein with 4Fe4S-binding SPASM domain